MQTILVVDDEPRIAELLSSFLLKNGFQVIKAPGGEEALAIIMARTKIDLILLDMKMPRIGGAEVIGKMRELGAAIPILILSGSLDALKNLSHLPAVTQDDILCKPVDLFALLEKVKKKLSAKKAQP